MMGGFADNLFSSSCVCLWRFRRVLLLEGFSVNFRGGMPT